MLNQDPAPIKPLDWTWIVQRSANDKDGKALSKWVFGFVDKDGADIRVTLHQTNDTDQADDATYYVTFFVNRNPESFTKWDTSLSHDESMLVWVTITHGMLDFIKKSNAKIIVFDDLANGKLKMVLRSLCLDLVDANPDYEFEQTKKSQFRTFYQIKKKGVPSAFEDQIAGNSQEGETAQPIPGMEQTPQDDQNPVADAQAPVVPSGAANDAAEPTEGTQDSSDDISKPDDAVDGNSEPEGDLPKVDPKNIVIEIGRDYSITARDSEGHAVDRYQAKNPGDVIRWINKKGYSGCKMKIVPKAQAPIIAAAEKEKPDVSECVIASNKIIVRRNLDANQAALLNMAVCAKAVRKLEEGIAFEWETNQDIDFKKAILLKALKEV